MKVMQINVVYKTGSTGKIVYELHSFLEKHNITSIVCYGRGNSIKEKNVYKTCSEFNAKINHALANIDGMMYSHGLIPTNHLLNIIKKEKPDIVHLHCLNGYFVDIYKLINYLKKAKIKTILTLHAEFMYTGGCGYSKLCNKWQNNNGCKHCKSYKEETGSLLFNQTNKMWRKMKKAFMGFDIDKIKITSVSPWLDNRVARSPILGNFNHKVILNGLDTNTFKYYETDDLRKSLNLENKKIIFHATPNFNDDKKHIKGGYYVLELAKKFKDEKEIVFVVAGNVTTKIEMPDNVILLGKVTNQELLAKYYSMANLTILTSQFETFSMVCAESLCSGTPVVGFKAGAPEQISIQQYSEFVEYGKIDELESAVKNWLNKSLNKKEIANMAKEKYSNQKMLDNYLIEYKKL